jgi:hypothetical protein
MGEQFSDKSRGQRIRADEWNRLTEAAERADNMRAGSGIALRRGTGSTAMTATGSGQAMLVRMVTDSVVREVSRVAAPEGQLPSLYNAVVQTWDDGKDAWVDREGAYLWVDNPCGIPITHDDYVIAIKQGTSGRVIAMPSTTTHVAVTVADSNADDYYPAPEKNPNTYCINFVTVPYFQVPGRNPIPADAAAPEEGDTPALNLGPADTPHATVINLYSGADNYVPEGSVIWCFLCGGRWFTYMSGASTSGEFLKIDRGEKDKYGRSPGTLVTYDADARTWTAGKKVLVTPLNDTPPFIVNRRYRCWKTKTNLRPGVGKCVSTPDGAPTTFTFNPISLIAPYDVLAGARTLTYTTGCTWEEEGTGDRWVLDATAGTLVGTAGEETVTYFLPEGWWALAAETELTYDSNTAGEDEADFDEIITMESPDPYTGDPEAIDDPESTEDDLAPVYPVYIANPNFMPDPDDPGCVDAYTGTVTVVTNVAVACVGSSIVTTQTKKNMNFECGRLVTVTDP